MRVDLHPGAGGRRYAVLRGLTGAEELAFGPDIAFAGAALIENLLVREAGASVGPGEADLLSIADRDRILAALYRANFGDHVASTCLCGACTERFEFGFNISDLESPQAGGPAVSGPDKEGRFRLARGEWFHLPTVADLKAIAGLDRSQALEALRARCLHGSDADVAAVEAAMERVGPLLSCDLEACCPHCGTVEIIAFDLERHFFGALAAERRYLTNEIHALASAYHWSLQEIAALPREDRRALVRCVEAGRQRSGFA